MKIDFSKTMEELQEENSRLDQLIQSAYAQEQTMHSVCAKDYGLEGNAYEAFTEKIHLRSLVIRTHYFAYEAIRAANNANIQALSTLESPYDDGAVDTDDCENEIRMLKEEQQRLDATKQMMIDQLVNQAKTCHGDNVYPSNRVASLEEFYEGSIAGCQATIDGFERIKQLAISYANNTINTYDSARSYVDTILSQATLIVDGYQRGEYSTEAIRALEVALVDRKIELAKPYLTEDELRAYQAALRNGRIDAGDIYLNANPAQAPSINENLYLALVKLPQEMLDASDVDAVAGAYQSMWTGRQIDDSVWGGKDIDHESIERLYELSYIYDASYGDPGLSGNRVSLPDEITWQKSPEGCENHNFYQSAFLSRINEAMQFRLLNASVDDRSYQPILAATNLMANVVMMKDVKALTGNPNNMEFEFNTVVSEGGTEDANDSSAREKDAVIAVLSFDVSNLAYLAKYMDYDGVVHDTQVTSITGTPNAVCETMNDLLTNEITSDKNYSAYGDLASAFTVSGISALGVVFPPSAVMSAIAGAALTGATTADAIAKDNELRRIIENNYWDTAAANTQSPVFEDMGFAIGFTSDRNTNMLKSLDANFDLVITRGSSERIGKSIDAFNIYSPNGGEYNHEQLVNDIQFDLLNSVDNGVEGDTHSVTNNYLTWGNSVADLVYNGDIAYPDGSMYEKGTPAKTPITNYTYNTGLYPEYCYRHEYEATEGKVSQ